jgi:tetratricopeptide (TPR) repeat protein
MKKQLLTLVLSFFIICSFANSNDDWENSISLYDIGSYDESIQLLDSISSTGFNSFELNYNKGNAYYRLGNITEAIYYYESALLLDPGNQDVSFNLSLLNQLIKDKDEFIPDYNMAFLMKEAQGVLPSKYLSLFGFVLLGIALLLGVLRLIISKKITPPIIVLVSIIGFSMVMLSKIEDHFSAKYIEAIVMSPRVTTYSSPTEDGNSLFILHEGLKVRVLESNRDWMKIQVNKDKVGWLPKLELREL